MSVPMTLSDLETRETRGPIFQADLLSKTHVPFDLERPNSAGKHEWGGAYTLS